MVWVDVAERQSDRRLMSSQIRPKWICNLYEYVGWIQYVQVVALGS